MKQWVCTIAIVLVLTISSKTQTTVNYTHNTSYYYAVFYDGAGGIFDPGGGSTDIGMYANSTGAKQTIAFRKFKTAGDNTGSNRTIQCGDKFTITLATTRAYGRIGLSLLASPTSVITWADKENNYAIATNLDGPLYIGGTTYGEWYIKYAAGALSVTSFGGTIDTYYDYKFEYTLTAPDRMNVTLSDNRPTPNSITYYDIPLNTSNPITDLALYMEDDWDGNNMSNAYWKSSVTSLTNTGIINIGQSNNTFTIAGIITNGIDANSTVTNSLNNALIKNGTGTITLTAANTYAGLTTINAGTLIFANTSGTTIPSGNNVTINGGTLQISENQTINNLTLTSGTLTVDAGKTLTINGTYTSTGGTIINNGTIVFNSSNSFPGTATTLSACYNLTCNANVTLNNSITVTNNLTLNSGTFALNNNHLILSGASLTATSGVMSGSTTSDLTVQGTTGGTVTIPLTSNITLRNITVSNTRTLAMNGIHDINLTGTMNIGSTATYDNGGESQIIDGGGTPVINIYGKFITRDAQGFTGTSSSIPGIAPTLFANCTIEYARAGDQAVSTRTDYRNLIFSNGGTKTTSGVITPIIGTVTIPDATIVDVDNHTFGDAVSPNQTNFTMSGAGRFRTSSTGTNPQMLGTYTLTNGTVEFYNSNITAQTVRNRTYFNIEVTGSNVANGPGLITLAAVGSFTVKTGGVFTINDDAIVGPTGVQTVTIESGALFKTGDVDGFSGGTGATSASIRNNIENVIINSSSTVEYSRFGDQVVTSRTDYANITISGSNNKTANGIVTLSGNLNLNSGILEDNGYTITITNGNITGNGTHTSTSPGKILMTGAGATISGATLGNLELNNAAGFSLSGSATITNPNTLTFTNGKLSLGAYDLSMQNSSTPFSGYSSSKYILTNGAGKIKQTITSGTGGTYYFPVGGTIGGTDYYNLASISWSTATGITQLTCRFIPSTLSNPIDLYSTAYGYLIPEFVPTPIITFLNNGYWEINTSGGTPANYQIDLTPKGYTNAGFYAQQHTIFKNATTDPSTWVFSGNATDLWGDYIAGGAYDMTPLTAIANFKLQNTNVSGFSNFAIGRSDDSYLLPIVLTDFTATLINADVWLQWHTSSEVNNDYFEIQRSLDGSIWNTLGQVDGAGSTSIPQSYAYTDNNAPGMILYYRLKQVDYNGEYAYSDIRVVNNLGNEPLIIFGYYTVAGQRISNLENAPAGIYFEVSNKGNRKVLKVEN